MMNRMARPFQHPAVKDLTIDGVLHALSDQTRRGIVAKLLSCNGMNCNKACEDMAPSTVSFHHKILRETGLIRSEKRGVEVFNTVRKADLDKRFPGLLAAVLSNHKPASKTSTKVPA